MFIMVKINDSETAMINIEHLRWVQDMGKMGTRLHFGISGPGSATRKYLTVLDSYNSMVDRISRYNQAVVQGFQPEAETIGEYLRKHGQ